jgi:hypothetical protein
MSQMNDRERPPHLAIVRNHSEQEEAVLAHALEQVANAVPECVAAGFVELRTGLMLGMKTVASHPLPLLDRVGDPLRQTHPARLESMFLKPHADGDFDERYFQEVLILSDNLIHVFQRCSKRHDVVLMTVCLSSANMGMVLERSRLQLPAVETAVTG